MKFKSKNGKTNWKKIGIIVALLAVAGYQWYVQNGRVNDQETIDVGEYIEKYEPTTGEDSKPIANPDTVRSGREASGNSNLDNGNDTEEFLVAVGGDKLQSPAGLIYGVGGGGEHRVDHVMKHIRDDPTRPVHGVFEGDRISVLKLIDDAYEMIKSESRYVKSEKSRGNTAYTVSMGSKIGYEGGQKGRRNGNRALRSLRLVLDGNEVITAYPYR